MVDRWGNPRIHDEVTRAAYLRGRAAAEAYLARQAATPVPANPIASIPAPPVSQSHLPTQSRGILPASSQRFTGGDAEPAKDWLQQAVGAAGTGLSAALDALGWAYDNSVKPALGTAYQQGAREGALVPALVKTLTSGVLTPRRGGPIQFFQDQLDYYNDPAQRQRLAQAGTAKDAYDVALETDPWGRFATEAALDPLNLVGVGLGNQVSKNLVKGARMAGASERVIRGAETVGQGIIKADETLDRLQALPITVPWKGVKAGGSLLDKLTGGWVSRTFVEASQRSQFLRQRANLVAAREAEADLNDTAGIVDLLEEASINTARAAADRQGLLRELPVHSVGRIATVAAKQGDTAIRQDALQELVSRGYAAETPAGTIQPTMSLAAHRSLDDALRFHQLGEKSVELTHGLLDAFVTAAYRSDPAKYGNDIDAAYRDLIFEATPSSEVPAGALASKMPTVPATPQGGQTLAQGARGTFQVSPSGKMLIRLGPDADITTVPHELAHLLRKVAGKDTRAILIRDAAGAATPLGKWTSANEERFAAGVENLLMEVDLEKLANSPHVGDLILMYRKLADASYLHGRPAQTLSPESRDELTRLLDGSPASGQAAPATVPAVDPALPQVSRDQPPGIPDPDVPPASPGAVTDPDTPSLVDQRLLPRFVPIPRRVTPPTTPPAQVVPDVPTPAPNGPEVVAAPTTVTPNRPLPTTGVDMPWLSSPVYTSWTTDIADDYLRRVAKGGTGEYRGAVGRAIDTIPGEVLDDLIRRVEAEATARPGDPTLRRYLASLRSRQELRRSPAPAVDIRGLADWFETPRRRVDGRNEAPVTKSKVGIDAKNRVHDLDDENLLLLRQEVASRDASAPRRDMTRTRGNLLAYIDGELKSRGESPLLVRVLRSRGVDLTTPKAIAAPPDEATALAKAVNQPEQLVAPADLPAANAVAEPSPTGLAGPAAPTEALAKQEAPALPPASELPPSAGASSVAPTRPVPVSPAPASSPLPTPARPTLSRRLIDDPDKLADWSDRLHHAVGEAKTTAGRHGLVWKNFNKLDDEALDLLAEDIQARYPESQLREMADRYVHGRRNPGGPYDNELVLGPRATPRPDKAAPAAPPPATVPADLAAPLKKLGDAWPVNGTEGKPEVIEATFRGLTDDQLRRLNEYGKSLPATAANLTRRQIGSAAGTTLRERAAKLESAELDAALRPYEEPASPETGAASGEVPTSSPDEPFVPGPTFVKPMPGRYFDPAKVSPKLRYAIDEMAVHEAENGTDSWTRWEPPFYKGQGTLTELYGELLGLDHTVVDPITRTRVLDRLSKTMHGELLGQPLSRSTGATSYATPPQVSDTPPLARASLDEVLDKIGGEVRAQPGQVDAAREALAPVLDGSGLRNAGLWYEHGPTRAAIQRVLAATDDASRVAAVNEVARSINSAASTMGAPLPGMLRLIGRKIEEFIAPPKREVTPRGDFSGRSAHGSYLPDSLASQLAEARNNPDIQKWEVEFEKRRSEVVAIAAENGLFVTDMTRVKDIHDLLPVLRADDKKAVEKWLKMGGWVDPATGNIRKFQATGFGDAWIKAAEKAAGIKPKAPPSGVVKALTKLRRGWVEQALLSPRYHVANLMDMTVKTLVEGYMPMIGETAFTRAVRWGIQVPDEVADQRGLMRTLQGDSLLDEFADPATSALPGALGRLSSWNRHMAYAMESAFRSWAWAGEMKLQLDAWQPHFIGEMRRMLPADVAEKAGALLSPRGVAFSRQDVIDAVTDAGGTPEVANNLAGIWHRGLLEASQRGIEAANRVHFDILDQKVVEEKLRIKSWAPFHFWATRNVPYYAQTLAQHPWMLRLWHRWSEATEEHREEAGLPSRFGSMLPVAGDDPLLKFLFGGNQVYFNPTVIISLADQMKPISDNPDETGWAKMMKELGRVGLRPAPWVEIPMIAAGLHGEDVEPGNVLRHTGLASAALATGLTNATGQPVSVDLEAPLKAGVRTLRGQPAPTSQTTLGGIPVGGSPYTDYQISKELAEMSVEEMGIPNHPDYTRAMVTPSSPLYQRAAARVWADQLRRQSYGMVSSIPMQALSDTEAAIRQRSGQVRAYTDTLTEEQRQVVNRHLAQTGDLGTAYWRATSDPRRAQLNADLAALPRGGNALQRRIAEQNLSPLYRQYVNWLRSQPSGSGPREFLQATRP